MKISKENNRNKYNFSIIKIECFIGKEISLNSTSKYLQKHDYANRDIKSTIDKYFDSERIVIKCKNKKSQNKVIVSFKK